MDKNGGGQHAVTNTGGYADFPDWSPDGRKIAFDGFQGSDPYDEIYVVNAANGGGLTALTSCAGYGAGLLQQLSGLVAGRPQDRVHPCRRQRCRRQRDQRAGLGHERERVQQDPADVRRLPATIRLPDWSPDGRKIAYEDERRARRIFTMRADGSHQTQLTFGDGGDFGAAWSPDGRKIAFVRNLGGGNRPVFVMNADGSNEHQLTPGTPRQFVPAWQPLGGDDD